MFLFIPKKIKRFSYLISIPLSLKVQLYSLVLSGTIKLRIFFIAANFDTLPRAQKLGSFHEFFFQEHPYVNKICAKFQGQKIHQKKDIESLPTCVVVDFHFYQLCHLLKDWKLFLLPWNFCYEITFMMIMRVSNFKFKIFTPKKIFEIYQHVFL